MKSREIILSEFNRLPENTLIQASKLYREKLSDQMEEAAYYQMLGRLCKSGELARVSRGIYCKPKASKYGTVLPSDREVVRTFTENRQGVVVGYSLYNSLKLTTQISKNIHIYSSLPEEQQKQIGSVIVRRYDMDYSSPVCSTIQMMEVLSHYSEIQELNHDQFQKMCVNFAGEYSDKTAEYVFRHIRYPKRSIAFLREILNARQKSNNLGKYLSALSVYHIPKTEVPYDSARA